jgi:predicted nucleic acid-binding Zn ribbon protein
LKNPLFFFNISMPLYCYRHPETEEEIDVMQGMNDVHEYFDENGVQWHRVFSVPNASIDTKTDAFSAQKFVERTASKKGSMGDMLDYSAEMSAKRAEQAGGIDPVKKKFFENYSKERKGAKHIEDRPKVIENKNFKIEL